MYFQKNQVCKIPPRGGTNVFLASFQFIFLCVMLSCSGLIAPLLVKICLLKDIFQMEKCILQ